MPSLYTHSSIFFLTEKPHPPAFKDPQIIGKSLKLTWEDDTPDITQYVLRYRVFGSDQAWKKINLSFTTRHYEIKDIKIGIIYEVRD